MKLVYWVAEARDDAKCYNVRARTKREAIRMVEENGGKFGKPHKVTVEYHSAFDLLNQAMGEGSITEHE